MNIVPDWVLVALQTLPFLVAFLALRSLLFRPLLALLDERRAAIQGARDEAERLRARVTEARAAWDQRLAEARAEGSAHRARLVSEAGVQRQALVDSAREAAELRVGAALRELGEARREATGRLDADARALAAAIAERVLGRLPAQV